MKKVFNRSFLAAERRLFTVSYRPRTRLPPTLLRETDDQLRRIVGLYHRGALGENPAPIHPNYPLVQFTRYLLRPLGSRPPGVGAGIPPGVEGCWLGGSTTLPLGVAVRTPGAGVRLCAPELFLLSLDLCLREFHCFVPFVGWKRKG